MATSIVDAINKDIAKRQAAKKTSNNKSSSSKNKKTVINGQTVYATQRKRDGSIIYYNRNNQVIREVNSKGNVVARVTVNTGVSGSGTGGSKTKALTASEQMRKKQQDANTRFLQQQAKAKAYSQGLTGKQQMAFQANQRFVNKVRESLSNNKQSLENNRSLLMSNNTLSGQSAKTITQGVVYKKTLESIRNSPFNIDVIKALTNAVDVSKVDPSKYRYGTITIAGQNISPSSLKEKNFYTYLSKVEARNNKVNDLALEIQSRALASQDKRGVTKFLSDKKVLKRFVDGLTKLGVGIIISPMIIVQALDNAFIRSRGSISRSTINSNLKKNLYAMAKVISPFITKRLTDKIANKITGVIPDKVLSPDVVGKELEATRPQKIKTTLKEVGKSFDPTKPENWANIITIVGGLALSGLSIRANLSKVKGSYVPSVRGIRTIEAGVDDILRTSPEIKRGIRSQIKSALTEREKRFLTRKLKNALALEKLAGKLKKSTIPKYLRYEREGKIIPVSDMNPLIATAEQLNNMGGFKYLYHVGTKSIKSAFKKGETPIIRPDAESSVVSRVRQKTFVPKRQLSAPRKVDKALVSFFRRSGGVVGGAKAQNVFVKRLFTRKTIDYDVFYKDPKLQARKALAYLKRKFPDDDVELVVLKIPNTKLTVYRVKFNGKDLADFDLMPKDLGVPVKVGKDLVANPEFLAKRKLSTQGDIAKAGRVVKDAGDLKRLLGRLSSEKDFVSFLNKPKNVFRVLAQPSGMGKGRVKFNEGQLFFDVEANVGYAIKSLVKNRFKGLPSLQRFAKSVAGKKVLLPKILRSKVLRRGAKGVILRLPVDINDFVKLPKRLLSRIRSASKGRLSKSQSDLLRKDLVKYIEEPKNMQKISLGSRSGSLSKGEREWVLSTFSELYKKTGRQKFTVDPTTKLFSEVIDVTLKQTKPTSKIARVLTSIKNKIKVFSPSELKRRFTKGDLTRLRRYKRLLKLKAKVSDPEYRDLLYYLDSMMSDKKGTRSFTKGLNTKSLSSSRKVSNNKIFNQAIKESIDFYKDKIKLNDKTLNTLSNAIKRDKKLLSNKELTISKKKLLSKNISVRESELKNLKTILKNSNKRALERIKSLGGQLKKSSISDNEIKKIIAKDNKIKKSFPKKFSEYRRLIKDVTRRRVGKISKRASPAIARRGVKTLTRGKSRVVSRPKIRTTSRSKARVVARPKSRVVSRPKARIVTRPKPRVTKRVTPRVRRPISRLRPRIVPRTVKLPPRIPSRIRTIIFKKRKKVSLKDKKELLEYVKKSKSSYRPSLSALIYGITAYKIPSSVNPFQIRPLLVQLRKKKIIK